MHTNNIYNMRKYKGLSRKDLSDLTNISDYRLRILESNTNNANVNFEELIDISIALDCSILDLTNDYFLNKFTKLNNKSLQDIINLANSLLERDKN